MGYPMIRSRMMGLVTTPLTTLQPPLAPPLVQPLCAVCDLYNNVRTAALSYDTVPHFYVFHIPRFLIFWSVCVCVGVVPGCATPRFWLFLGPFFHFMHFSEFPFGRKKTSEVKFFSLFFQNVQNILGKFLKNLFSFFAQIPHANIFGRSL